MGILDRLSIRWILTGTFAAITALLVLFSVYNLSQMNRLRDLTVILHDHPLRVSNAALLAQTGVVRMHRSMKDVVLSRNETELQSALDLVNDEERKVFLQLRVVQQNILGSEGRELVDETITAFSAWKSIRDRVVRLMRLGERAAAVEITKGEGAKHVQLLESKTGALTAYARNKAEGFLDNALTTHGEVSRTALGVVVAMILLLGLFWTGIRRIVFGLAGLQETLTAMSESGNLAEVEVRGSNELAELSKSYNRVIRALQREFQLRQGLNDLSDQLLAVKHQEELESVLTFLARYVDASSAAMFSYDGEGELSLIAAHALVLDAGHPTNFTLGQGVVGQAASDLEPLHLVGGEDPALITVSGTGQMAPKSIMVIPLVFNQQLTGVMEFAFLSDDEVSDLEFLKQAAAPVAALMLSMEARWQIDQLYREASQANRALEEKSKELEELNQELSQRNEELAGQSDELESRTEDLSRLADQLSRQKRKLEEKRRQAEEADRLKSEFLSNMSHELRTPLNSILALSQLMLRRNQYAEGSKDGEYLTVIERNGRHLLTLINNLLDLSKIESQRMEVNAVRFDPAQVLAEVMETMTPLARDKRLEIDSDVDFSGTMFSDREKIFQVLLNLVSNAVKFTDSGRIGLELSREDDRAVFIVSDTGIGIPSQELESIFDQFKQVDGSTTRRHDGTGLGLTISRQFAEMLGGDLHVVSEAGMGSRFIMRLPLELEGDFDISLSQDLHSSSHMDKRIILVVDDIPQQRRMVRMFLEDNGYTVLECSSGAEALGIAKTANLFAILLDVYMPEMDGWEVLRRLRSDPSSADIPVVLLTISRDQISGMALGANGHLTKPISKDILASELKRLEKRRNIRLVLAVDDDLAMRESMRDLIEEAGYRAALAEDGEQGMTKARRLRPDVILLDLYMPNMDGFAMLEGLRAEPPLQQIPVIIVSAAELAPEKRAQLMLEASAVIQKKGDVDNVLQAISRELGLLERELEIVPESEVRPLAAPQAAVRTNAVPKAVDDAEVTILAVEDNKTNILVLKEIMSDTPWNLVVAETGLKGLELARNMLPTIILMDIHLPDVNGMDVTRALKSDPATSAIPVIVVTARVMAQDREIFLDAGGDDYLSKPYDPDDLVNIVRKWLGREGEADV